MNTPTSRISLAGVWLWLWGLWHLAWVAALLLVPWLTDGRGWVLYVTGLYAAFFPMEIVGVIDLQDDTGRERAKTLSQWRQYVAEMTPDPRFASWRALGSLSGLVDAFLVASVTWYHLDGIGLFPGFAVIGATLVGCTVGALLVPHFGWRDTFG